MVQHSESNSKQGVDWSQVRLIYKKLSDEFHVLTGAFGFVLDPRTKLQLDYLILAIDGIDHTLDAMIDAEERQVFSQAIHDFLTEKEDKLDNAKISEVLRQHLAYLRNSLIEKGSTPKFVEAVSEIFHHTEAKRHVVDFSQLMDHILKEGNATGQLPLSLISNSAPNEFHSFFAALCSIMGIADLVVDAKEDYKNGILSIPPNLFFYLRLMYILIAKGFRILWSFPQKLKFIAYCIRFGWYLSRGA